jgi:hypothetical protein
MKYIKRLACYPKEVWDDVEDYVWGKYRIPTPRNEFKFYKMIHSKAFNYRKFVSDISRTHSMLLFTLVCKKLGIGFIKVENTIELVILNDSAIEAFQYYVENTSRIQLDDSPEESTEKVLVIK